MGILQTLDKWIGISDMMAVNVSGKKNNGYSWLTAMDNKSVTDNFRCSSDYLKAPQLVSWVNIACSIIGQQVAMTNWGIYDKNNEPTKNKELIALFNKPNPLMTFFTFREYLIWHLLLTGNAYILKDSATLYDLSKNKYSQLWILNSGNTNPILTANGISGYKQSLSTGAELIYPVEKIIHIKLPNPVDSRIGMGKIQANEILYNTEYSTQYFNWNFFAKGGAPGMALEIPGEFADEEQKNALLARLKQYQTVENSNKTIPLTGGMKLTPITLSQQDMMFIDQRKFSREEILGIFGVPPACAGIFEYANYANTKEQKNILKEDTITPYLMRLNEAFTIGIVKDFEPDQSFFFDNIIKKDDDLYNRLATQAVAGGVMTINEVRKIYLDIEESENEMADELFLPINLIPITDSGMSDVTPPAKEDGKGFDYINKKISASVRQQIFKSSLNTRRKIGKTIKKEMKTLFDEQEARVLSAIDSQKSMKAISADDIFNFEKEKEHLLKAIRKGHTGIIMKAIDDTSTSLGIEVDSSTSNPQVTARIGRLARKVTEVNTTTKNKIENAIKQGVDAGESIGELKNRVSEVFKQAKGYRAEMIARTESAKAYDMGSIITYKEAEIEYVDVIGCEDNETDCNKQHTPIDEADDLEFHPNHTGVIVPEIA